MEPFTCNWSLLCIVSCLFVPGSKRFVQVGVKAPASSSRKTCGTNLIGDLLVHYHKASNCTISKCIEISKSSAYSPFNFFLRLIPIYFYSKYPTCLNTSCYMPSDISLTICACHTPVVSLSKMLLQRMTLHSRGTLLRNDTAPRSTFPSSLPRERTRIRPRNSLPILECFSV